MAARKNKGPKHPDQLAREEAENAIRGRRAMGTILLRESPLPSSYDNHIALAADVLDLVTQAREQGLVLVLLPSTAGQYRATRISDDPTDACHGVVVALAGKDHYVRFASGEQRRAFARAMARLNNFDDEDSGVIARGWERVAREQLEPVATVWPDHQAHAVEVEAIIALGGGRP